MKSIEQYAARNISSLNFRLLGEGQASAETD